MIHSELKVAVHFIILKLNAVLDFVLKDNNFGNDSIIQRIRRT